MEVNTGHLHFLDEEELNDFTKISERAYNEKKKMVEVFEDEVKEFEAMGVQQRKGWMRNKPYPCGSGKKFKKCCWSKFE